MSLSKGSNYDVVIVGGGMVGASLACALQQAPKELPLNILLVESQNIQTQKAAQQPSFDLRSTVLSFGTAQYFEQLGLWKILKEHAEDIKKIHVSDQGKFGAVRMDSNEQGVDALGYVLENKVIGAALNQAMLAADRVEICSPATVENLIPDTNGFTLQLESKGESSSIKSKLVVLAEGGRSGLCEQLGIFRDSKEYAQSAIITIVAFTEPHNNVAYERFTPKGPMAILPLADFDGKHRAALVWTQSSAEIEEVMALDDDAFLQALQNDFGSRVGNFIQVGERASYPLSLQQTEEQIRPGLVLLGNVAHTLHPVAGQGFNLALRDTMRLTENIIKAVQAGDNPGSIFSLQNYLLSTESDQDKTIAFSHYMTALFSNNNEALIWARKLGLFSIDLLPTVKKHLSRQAMGVSEPMVSL